MQQPSKNFSVDLTNTTLEDALEHLSTLTKMFWKPLNPNTIFLTNDNVTKRRDYEENVVKVFYLQNITSVQELNEISVAIRSVTEIRRLFTYNAQNAILARGTVDQVALVEKLLQDLDKPKAEVLVDVVVIETSRGRTRELASALSSTSGSSTTNGISVGVTPALGSDGKSNSLRLTELTSLSAGDFAINLPSAILRAVMSDSNARVRQTPQVRAADGMKASLKIGEKVPTASGSFQPGIGLGGGGVSPLVNTQFQYLDVGVNVDILPKIHGADEVSLHVEIDISTVRERIDIGGIQQPVIGQRKVIHDLRLREGEMNLIGGLVQQNETRTNSGIPLLMQIPYLGRLFSNESINRSESELMIALVPHIVRSQEITPVNLRGIAAGADQTIRLIRSIPESDAAPGPAAPPPTNLDAPKPGTDAPKANLIAPAAPVKLVWQPEGVVTRAGSPVVVTLQVAEAVDLFSAPMKVKYDPKKLKLAAATAGAFLSTDGQRVNFAYQDAPDAGEVSVILNRLPGVPGLTGSGALLSLTFQALAAGETTVTIVDSGLKNSKLQPVPAQTPGVAVEIR
jgi:general secretion pathway protein D